jgi:hypothetical protein
MSRATRHLATLACMLSMIAASDTNFVDRIQGYYSAPGRLCTDLEGRKYLPCDPPIPDCLKITKVDDTHAKVIVDSFQRNGAECGVEGIAKASGDALEYVDQSPSYLPASGSKLIIHLTNGVITFESISATPSISGDPFCGAGGQMRWVKFLLRDKRPVDSDLCGSEATPNR